MSDHHQQELGSSANGGTENFLAKFAYQPSAEGRRHGAEVGPASNDFEKVNNGLVDGQTHSCAFAWSFRLAAAPMHLQSMLSAQLT